MGLSKKLRNVEAKAFELLCTTDHLCVTFNLNVMKSRQQLHLLSFGHVRGKKSSFGSPQPVTTLNWVSFHVLCISMVFTTRFRAKTLIHTAWWSSSVGISVFVDRRLLSSRLGWISGPPLWTRWSCRNS